MPPPQYVDNVIMMKIQLGNDQQQGQQQRNASNSGETSTRSTASKEGVPTTTVAVPVITETQYK
jgi:hypothetical protein